MVDAWWLGNQTSDPIDATGQRFGMAHTFIGRSLLAMDFVGGG